MQSKVRHFYMMIQDETHWNKNVSLQGKHQTKPKAKAMISVY